MAHTTLPSAFRDLYAEVRRKLPTHGARRPGSSLRLLPLTLKAVADRSRTSGPLNALSAATKVPAWTLFSLLCRSGFYHGVAEGRSTRKLWSELGPRLFQRPVRTRILILLDGCRFPLARFGVPGGEVEQFSPSAIAMLGPRPEIANTFPPGSFSIPDGMPSNGFSASIARTMRAPPASPTSSDTI